MPSKIRKRQPCHRCESSYSEHTSGFQTIWHWTCEQMTRDKTSLYVTDLHLYFLSKILQDSLLTHRFNQGLASLIGLTGKCYKVPELFCMAGLEILKNIPSTHMVCVQFYKNMFLACPKHQEEILLNFALYLVLRKHDVTEGLELLKSRSTKAPFSENCFHKAYIALFEYILWKPQPASNIENRTSHWEQDDTVFSDDDLAEFGEKSVERKTDFSAEHAINLFEEVFSTPGIWDIFVPANVHLLEHCKGVSYAKKFLEEYRNRNILNPNAHRYFYHFLKSNSGSDKELLNVLEDLIKLDPTSELLGDFIDLKIKSCEKEAIMEPIFRKLDHAGCMYDEETWKMLESYLVPKDGSKIDCVIREEVDSCWKERKGWWPGYHFRLSQNIGGSVKWTVMLIKANVAEYLLGENNFSKKIRSSYTIHGRSTTYVGEDSSTDENSSTNEDRFMRKRSKTHSGLDRTRPIKRAKR